MLRDLIRQKHDVVENHRFIKYLFSGVISRKIYVDYLYNLLYIYKSLEQRANQLGVLNGIETIQRSDHIQKDFISLVDYNYAVTLYQSTQDYLTYIETVSSKKNYGTHLCQTYG